MLAIMNTQTKLLFVDDAIGHQEGPLHGVVVWTRVLPLVCTFPSILVAKHACDLLASRGYPVAVVSVTIL